MNNLPTSTTLLSIYLTVYQAPSVTSTAELTLMRGKELLFVSYTSLPSFKYTLVNSEPRIVSAVKMSPSGVSVLKVKPTSCRSDALNS